MTQHVIRRTDDLVAAPVAQRSSSQLVVDPTFVLLVVGFGLFKAVIDQAYSSALFTARSSYPIINNVEFSVAASIVILVTCVGVVLVGWRHRSATLRGPGVACMAVLLGVECASVLGVSVPGTGAVLPVVYGLAAVVSNAAWLVPIACLPARGCLAVLASSYLLAKVVSEMVAALPVAGALAVVVVGGVASIALFCAPPVRTGCPHVPAAPQGPERLPEAARAMVVDLAGPLAVFVVLNLVLGLIVAFQVTGLQAVEGSSFLKAVASGAASLVLLGVAVFAKGVPNIRRAFGLLFPVVALLLMALPFMDHIYGALFGVLLMFLQGIVSLMVLFMLLEASKRLEVPVICTVAAISFASRTFVLVGLVAGALLGADARLDDTVRALIVVVVAIYLLALVLVWLLRGRTGARGDSHGIGAELSTFDELDGVEKPASEPEHDSGGSERGFSEPEVADALAVRAQVQADRHHLTAREAEVALLLARGRSAGYIAEALSISPHTVRGYIKDAYAKLGVHSKQELIDRYTVDEA